MLVCAYCGERAPDNAYQSCCGEIHFEEVPDECPECGSNDLYESHHSATALAPEADAWNCGECGNQFNIS
jgi:rubredoxin